MDQQELRERQRAPKLKQLEPNTNTSSFGYIPENGPRLNPTAVSLPPNRPAPPSNMSAKPVFPHRILPLPVPTGSPRFVPFTAARDAAPRPSPYPYNSLVPSPHTGLSQPTGPRLCPSNMVPESSQNDGSYMTPNRTPPPTTRATPQYTYANLQTPTARAAGGIPGSTLQPPHNSTLQPTPRAVSMPYILPKRSSSRSECQAVGAVADADAQPLTPQNTGPPFLRARSSTPLQNADPHRVRAQSSPIRSASMPTFQNTEQSPSCYGRQRTFQSIPVTKSVRDQALPFQNAGSPPYQNGPPPVHNTPLPFQNEQPLYQNDRPIQDTPPYSQNGYFQNGQPYSHVYFQHGQPYSQNVYFQNGQPYYQNGYYQNGQPYSQNGYVQNGQPYSQNGCFQNGQPPFQNHPLPITNYSLPFNNSQLPSHQNGGLASIPHSEPGSGVAGQPSIPSAQPAPTGPSTGNNPSFQPILNSQLAVPQAPRPPPTPHLPYRVPIVPSSAVPQVPPLLAWHYMEVEEEVEVGEEVEEEVEEEVGEEAEEEEEEESSYLFSPPVGIMRYLY